MRTIFLCVLFVVAVLGDPLALLNNGHSYALPGGVFTTQNNNFFYQFSFENSFACGANCSLCQYYGSNVTKVNDYCLYYYDQQHLQPLTGGFQIGAYGSGSPENAYSCPKRTTYINVHCNQLKTELVFVQENPTCTYTLNFNIRGDCNPNSGSAPNTDNLKYLGCFQDNYFMTFAGPQRDLPSGPHYTSTGPMSASICDTICRSSAPNGPYKYAGLQNGAECWCGNSYGAFSSALPSASCNSLCSPSSPSAGYCGGRNFNSIYATELVGRTNLWQFEGKLSNSYNGGTTLTPVGNVGFIPTKCGQGLYLDHTSHNYLRSTNSAVTMTGDFTVAFWFKGTIPADVGVPGVAIIGQRRGCVVSNFWDITTFQRFLRMEFATGSNSHYAYLPDLIEIKDNTLYHLALTRQGQTVSAWINGTMIKSFTPFSSWPRSPVDGPLIVGGLTDCNRMALSSAMFDNLVIADQYYDPSTLMGTCTTSLRSPALLDNHVVADQSKKAYLGCFSDNYYNNYPGPQRDLPDGPHYAANFGAMSASVCINMCLESPKGPFAYAGLQFGQECWCGNTYGAYSTALPEGTCNMPCWGSTNETCGGSNLNSIFSTGYFTNTTSVDNAPSRILTSTIPALPLAPSQPTPYPSHPYVPPPPTDSYTHTYYLVVPSPVLGVGLCAFTAMLSFLIWRRKHHQIQRAAHKDILLVPLASK